MKSKKIIAMSLSLLMVSLSIPTFAQQIRDEIRNLKREIQSSLEDSLSEMLLLNKFESSNKIKIDFKAGKLDIKPVNSKYPKKTKNTSKI